MREIYKRKRLLAPKKTRKDGEPNSGSNIPLLRYQKEAKKIIDLDRFYGAHPRPIEEYTRKQLYDFMMAHKYRHTYRLQGKTKPQLYAHFIEFVKNNDVDLTGALHVNTKPIADKIKKIIKSGVSRVEENAQLQNIVKELTGVPAKAEVPAKAQAKAKAPAKAKATNLSWADFRAEMRPKIPKIYSPTETMQILGQLYRGETTLKELKSGEMKKFIESAKRKDARASNRTTTAKRRATRAMAKFDKSMAEMKRSATSAEMKKFIESAKKQAEEASSRLKKDKYDATQFGKKFMTAEELKKVKKREQRNRKKERERAIKVMGSGKKMMII